MTKHYITIKEATEKFVNELNAVETTMIGELMYHNPDDWEDVTVMNGDEDRLRRELPTWGTMWSFSSIFDDTWLEEEDGIEQMSRIGFVIFRSESYGFFFGIDGGGYDFYEQYWIPLYKARGLQWHETEGEE